MRLQRIYEEQLDLLRRGDAAPLVEKALSSRRGSGDARARPEGEGRARGYVPQLHSDAIER